MNPSTLLLCVTFFALGTFACGKKENKTVVIPENILNEEQYANLLVDFSLSESVSNMNVKNVPIHKMDSVYSFDPLQENQIRTSQYDSTVAFYSQNSELNKRVYERVLTIISEIQTKRQARDSASK